MSEGNSDDHSKITHLPAPQENIIKFPLSAVQSPEKLETSAVELPPIIRFPKTNEDVAMARGKENLNGNVKANEMKRAGKELVTMHSLSILGGFFDTALSTKSREERKFLYDGASEALVAQILPHIAGNNRQNAIDGVYSYLDQAVQDREASGARKFPAAEPRDLEGANSSSVAEIIQEAVDAGATSKIIEAKAQRLASGVLGISVGDSHPMLDERMDKDRAFIVNTLSYKRLSPSFRPTIIK